MKESWDDQVAKGCPIIIIWIFFIASFVLFPFVIPYLPWQGIVFGVFALIFLGYCMYRAFIKPVQDENKRNAIRLFNEQKERIRLQHLSWVCPKGHKNYKTGEPFCPDCGSLLNPPIKKVFRCQQGHEGCSSYKFCPKCGSEVRLVE